ncbi:MAG: phage tail protein [Chloroflexota bacterium]|nr:phage tail protein [Chloroflexota bacterium]
MAKSNQGMKKWVEPPAATFRYYVELKSIIEGAFIECSGLNMERDVYEYKEGGVNDHIHVLTGRAKYGGNIVLKRGVTYSDALWKWFQKDLTQGKVTPVQMAVILIVRYDFKRKKRIALRWNVAQAFPVKWTGPNLSMSGNDVAVETIEIAHQGLKMECLEF